MRSNMTVFAIAQARVIDRAQLNNYVAAASPTLQAHGARVIAFDESPEVIEGATDKPRTVIVEFESAEAFHKWYESPEYQAAKTLREGASVGDFILVTGL